MKHLLRNKLVHELSLLTPEQITKKSEAIQKNIFLLESFNNACVIGLYASTKSEVSTIALIQALLQLQKTVALPKVINDSLVFQEIKSMEDLKIGYCHILEPKDDCPVITTSRLDIVIIPCIGVDKSGNRLGHGKGFYDRFLAQNPTLTTVCFAYDFQVLTSIQPESHDYPVDIIVTEAGIIQAVTSNYNKKLLHGTPLAASLLTQAAVKIKYASIDATLAVILVGNNDASRLYVEKKSEKCLDVGIKFTISLFNETATEQEIIKKIVDYNLDPDITGIMVQLPLPKHINTQAILNTVAPIKDVDGLCDVNRQQLMQGNETLACCTPKGIIALLQHYNISLHDKQVLLVGHGFLVGKPLSMMLQNRGIPFAVCTNKTENLGQQIRQADIVISATGAPHLITQKDVKDDAVIIDAGTARLDNKIVGDVDYKQILNKVSLVTPVPGGVGPVTIAMLVENIIEAYDLQHTKNLPRPESII